MACSSFCLKQFDSPVELLKVFLKISNNLAKIEEKFHTLKKTKTFKQLKINEKLNQLKV